MNSALASSLKPLEGKPKHALLPYLRTGYFFAIFQHNLKPGISECCYNAFRHVLRFLHVDVIIGSIDLTGQDCSRNYRIYLMWIGHESATMSREAFAKELEWFSWFAVSRDRRRITRKDQQLLEPRVRRFLKSYLSASEEQKIEYYEATAGASAGCMPQNSIGLESSEIAKAVAEKASNVVRLRQNGERLDHGDPERFITDAIATVAVAYRRAAGAYAADQNMQKLGTAAVHLLTIATSHMMARE